MLDPESMKAPKTAHLKLTISVDRVYPLAENWRKFKKYLDDPEIVGVHARCMKALRPEYEPATHVPRDAGWCLDLPRPRTRACLQAYQCFGNCHAIAPLMLALARKAEPRETWWLASAPEHTAVFSASGYLLDVNAVGLSDTETLSTFARKCRAASVYASVLEYAFLHLGGGQYRASYPLRPSCVARRE